MGGVSASARRRPNAASCAFSASISVASSTEANSSARLVTIGRDGLRLLRREPTSADVVEQVGVGERAVFGVFDVGCRTTPRSAGMRV